jgi:predicted HTH transcriptional regulator
MLVPKKNEEFLKSLLKNKEGLTIDFKQSITSSQKIAKTLVAFANTAGGVIVIGVSDGKKIIGIDPEEELFMVEKANVEFCDPQTSLKFDLFETMEINEKDIEIEKSVLLVYVEKSNLNHFYLNGNNTRVYYKRIGDQTLPENEPNL